MKGTKMILAALAVIAITEDFRVEGLPRPQMDDDNFTFVDGFAFDGSAERQIPFGTTSARTPQSRRTTQRTVSQPIIPVTVAGSTTVAPNVARCVQNCRFQVTSEYNPVCGTDEQKYDNPGMLNCARNCGQDVRQKHVGLCTSNIRG